MGAPLITYQLRRLSLEHTLAFWPANTRSLKRVKGSWSEQALRGMGQLFHIAPTGKPQSIDLNDENMPPAQ